MNDKEAVKVLIAHRIRFADDFGWDKSTIEALDIAIASLATELKSAVPLNQEMSAKEFAVVRDRLCNSMNECTSCPIYKACLANSLVKVLPMIEAFAREHPEERGEDDGE